MMGSLTYWAGVTAVILLILWGAWLKYGNREPQDFLDI
jgi:hypothetical protein